MKEIIVTTQSELDAAVKVKDVEIVVKDTKEALHVYGNATIQYVYDNATIQCVYDNATIQCVYGNATIKRVYGNATIQHVYDNATIQCYSAAVTIEVAAICAVIIMVGCVCKIKRKTKTVSVVKTKQAGNYTKKDFIDIYGEEDGIVTLYKSVNPDTLCDFYTGKVKYQGTVICPDWDNDKKKQCGGGLHLSPLPHMALKYNEGKLLKCKVHRKDFVVYPHDITKVRCKKVTVIGEYKP